MNLRSLLFVPGDRPERMEKALAGAADALILDLEDSVAEAGKAAAREAVGAFIAASRGRKPLLVRINPVGGAHWRTDLAMADRSGADGIVLPKSESARTVGAVVADWQGAAPARVLPIATETPAALFGLGSYGEVSGSLIGLTWGAEDLSAAVGSLAAREADGRYTPPYEHARSLALFGAAAAGVPAIETVYPDFRDLEGLGRYLERARRDGFTAMMAIHPAQVDPINRAFTPTDAEVAWAADVEALFAANPGAGALQLAGRMVDAPHRRLAQRILERAGRGRVGATGARGA